jgi:uncharacterized protein YqfA (UPF0365 family)
MPFTAQERTTLLAAPMVGKTVVQRLEEIGLDSFAALQHADVDMVTALIADMLGTTCWRNSPQAKKAITNAIATARHAMQHTL